MIEILNNQSLNEFGLSFEFIVLLLISSVLKRLEQIFYKSIDTEHLFC